VDARHLSPLFSIISATPDDGLAAQKKHALPKMTERADGVV